MNKKEAYYASDFLPKLLRFADQSFDPAELYRKEGALLQMSHQDIIKIISGLRLDDTLDLHGFFRSIYDDIIPSRIHYSDEKIQELIGEAYRTSMHDYISWMEKRLQRFHINAIGIWSGKSDEQKRSIEYKVSEIEKCVRNLGLRLQVIAINQKVILDDTEEPMLARLLQTVKTRFGALLNPPKDAYNLLK